MTIAHVINLGKRMEKYDKLQEDTKHLNSIKLKRFDAIEHKMGYVGCMMSHQQILKENTCENVLIFEDDILIKTPKYFDRKWLAIKLWLDNNDDKWDVFYGGPCYTRRGKYKLLDNANKIVLLSKAGGAHFVYYNKNFIQKVLLIDPTQTLADHLHDIYPDIRITTCIPFLAIQHDGYSDIGKLTINKSELFRKTEKIISRNMII